MSGSGDLRVSDADREDAARELREHYAAGRLTDDEFNERLEAAYAARSAGDLAALRADLPRLPPTPAQRKAALAARRTHLRRRVVQEAGGSLVPFVVCVFVWLASGAGNFWPVWVLIPFVISIVRNGSRLYGADPDFERVERGRDRRTRHRH